MGSPVNYSVTISLDTATLTALQSGWQMQVFKGAQSPAAASAVPVVWFPLSTFASTVSINWVDNYGGYFSNVIAEPGATITLTTASPMLPGDLFTLQTNGQGIVSDGTVATAYSFASDQQTEWTCGLTTAANGGSPTAICAFPQYGAAGNEIMPYETIVILFTQNEANTGSVVQTALTPSVTIVLSASQPSCSISFDINTGWNTSGQANVTVNPINFALAPVLYIPAATSSTSAAVGKINVAPGSKR